MCQLMLLILICVIQGLECKCTIYFSILINLLYKIYWIINNSIIYLYCIINLILIFIRDPYFYLLTYRYVYLYTLWLAYKLIVCWPLKNCLSNILSTGKSLDGCLSFERNIRRSTVNNFKFTRRFLKRFVNLVRFRCICKLKSCRLPIV